MTAVTARWDDQDPWDRWKLTPYVPVDPVPVVTLCTPCSSIPAPQVVAYGAIEGRALCDARMTFYQRRERGRFGQRSSSTHTGPCPRAAVIQVLYDDGTVAVRCKEHTP